MKTFYVFLRITENGKSFLTETAEIAYNKEDACNKALQGWGDATVEITSCFRGGGLI